MPGSLNNRRILIKNCATHPLALILALWACVAAGWAAGPTITNIRSGQRPGTELVDIDYDLADPDSATLTISVAVSDNGGASYTVPATSFAGAVGGGVTPGRGKRITWNAGLHWPNNFLANVRFRLTASDDAVPPAPSGMALIPAGSFQMGDPFNEGDSNELPVHPVFISAFYMDKYEVEEEMERKFGRPITPQKIDHPEKTPVESAVDAVEKAAVKVATRTRGVS